MFKPQATECKNRRKREKLIDRGIQEKDTISSHRGRASEIDSRQLDREILLQADRGRISQYKNFDH